MIAQLGINLFQVEEGLIITSDDPITSGDYCHYNINDPSKIKKISDVDDPSCLDIKPKKIIATVGFSLKGLPMINASSLVTVFSRSDLFTAIEKARNSKIIGTDIVNDVIQSKLNTLTSITLEIIDNREVTVKSINFLK